MLIEIKTSRGLRRWLILTHIAGLLLVWWAAVPFLVASALSALILVSVVVNLYRAAPVAFADGIVALEIGDPNIMHVTRADGRRQRVVEVVSLWTTCLVTVLRIRLAGVRRCSNLVIAVDAVDPDSYRQLRAGLLGRCPVTARP